MARSVMIGNFPLYDKSFAETSSTGWYEAYKEGAHEWIVLECFRDGSCSKRTFETSKALARKAVDLLNSKQKNELPYYIDHGVKYYHQTI